MVRDSTNVSDLALALFGGPLEDVVPEGPLDAVGSATCGVSMLQGYVTLRAAPRTLSLVKGLRALLDDHLAARITGGLTAAPGAVSASGGKGGTGAGSLPAAVLSLLRSEDGYEKYNQVDSSYGPAASQGRAFRGCRLHP